MLRALEIMEHFNPLWIGMPWIVTGALGALCALRTTGSSRVSDRSFV